jgi:DNA-binding LytR/AlgR family response regulator
MPTALIADDEPHLVEFLRVRLALLWPELEVVAAVDNGLDALRIVREKSPDIAFLDIRMPGLTGLEVARQLQEGPARPRIVFVTAFDQYAIDAFDADAVDYLLKPVSDERLERTIEKLRAGLAQPRSAPDLTNLLAQLAQHIGAPAAQPLRWIRASRRLIDGEVTEQIAVADVLYFQADDKYTCVVLREAASTRELLIRVPLSELNEQLDKRDFQQIHRSVIVNLSAVAGTRRDLAGKLFVRLRDLARELPVARQYVHLFRQM